MNMLRFGRTICTARNPKCADCDMRRMCPYYKDKIPGKSKGGEMHLSQKQTSP